MSNGRLLWFRSTEWMSFYAEGQTFRPDADGYIAIPENVATQIRHPSLQYVGRERPKKPEELQTAVAVSSAASSTTHAKASGGDETTGVTLDKPNSTQRGAYRGALEAWMAPQPLNTLQRMGSAAIAREFEDYCERERPEVLLTLPKRLRSIEPAIARITARRVAAATNSVGAKKQDPKRH